jgi:[ribosomal protein S5]-alanine N-acetyltransferase
MAPVATPVVETDHLILRGPAPGDAEAWAAYLADPDVLRYLPKRAMTPLQRAENSLNALNLAWQQQPVSDFGWVVTLKSDGKLIGWGGVGAALEGNEAELVYSLGKPFWRQGFATEAARAMVRFGFENSTWDRIVAAIIPGNIASRRVLEHIGLVYEKDVNYLEMTGDTTIELDSPMVPFFAVTRDEFVPGAALYRVEKPTAP